MTGFLRRLPQNRHVIDDAGTEAQRPGLPEPEFPTARFPREGYGAAEVDEFVGELQRALRKDPPAMAPYEIADQRFKVGRVGRRYRLREVDDYLDRAEAEFRERHGKDAVALVEGRPPVPHHVRTWWIYLIALVIAAALVAFLLTNL